MIRLKLTQLFVLGVICVVGFFVFGVNIAYLEHGFLLWAHADSGVIIEADGFLVRIDNHWIGIAKMHDAMFDMPLATWFVIGFVLYGAWMVLFDWESGKPIERE